MRENCNFIYWRINKSIKILVSWWEVLGFSPYLCWYPLLPRPTLSSCPFCVMALGIKMALLFENKMSFAALTTEAFLIPLDTCSIAPSSFLSRLFPAFQWFYQLLSYGSQFNLGHSNGDKEHPREASTSISRTTPQLLPLSFCDHHSEPSLNSLSILSCCFSAPAMFNLLTCLWILLPCSPVYATHTLAPSWQTLTWNTQVTGPKGLRSLACTLWTGTVIYSALMFSAIQWRQK